jgi:hypothetical protein
VRTASSFARVNVQRFSDESIQELIVCSSARGHRRSQSAAPASRDGGPRASSCCGGARVSSSEVGAIGRNAVAVVESAEDRVSEHEVRVGLRRRPARPPRSWEMPARISFAQGRTGSDHEPSGSIPRRRRRDLPRDSEQRLQDRRARLDVKVTTRLRMWRHAPSVMASALTNGRRCAICAGIAACGRAIRCAQ